MSKGEHIDRMRAESAIDSVQQNNDSDVYLREYSTSYAGRSTTTSLMSRFVDDHDISQGDAVRQFYDEDSGALVILPASED